MPPGGEAEGERGEGLGARPERQQAKGPREVVLRAVAENDRSTQCAQVNGKHWPQKNAENAQGKDQ